MSSLPGAPATLYLDFIGDFEAAWSNGYTNFSNITTPLFDHAANASSFTDADVAEVNEIYQRVAEAYRPFNINVTTVDPGENIAGKDLTVAIGGTWSDWFGTEASGISNIGGFVNGNNTTFVFSDYIGANAEKIATTISHESGHEFGLGHHSTYDASNAKVQEYDPGSAPVVAPIMGSNMSLSARHLWGRGWTGDSPTLQDDMDIIAGSANGFGYKDDGQGHGLGAATGWGMIGGSNTFSGQGWIVPVQGGDSTQTSGDYFTFTTTGSGAVSVTVSVPQVGATLAPYLWLLDSSGNTIAAGPGNNLTQTGLAAGTYYVVVGGQSTTTTDVGSHVTTYPGVGSYSLSATVTQAAMDTHDTTFVAAAYQDVLGRFADSGGLAYWTAALNTGLSRAAFANALTHSAEYFTDFVTAAYARYLGRTPDAGGQAGWVAAMQAGLTDEQLEAGFIGSAEYIANHGGAGAGWVEGMYQDLLGRTPAQAEVDSWVQALADGMATTQVAYGFAASPERETNRVTADYQAFLGRQPDAGGLAWWVNGFLSGGLRNEDVVAGFVASDEYFSKHFG